MMNWKSIWSGIVGAVGGAIILYGLTAFVGMYNQGNANTTDIGHNNEAIVKANIEIKEAAEERKKLMESITAMREDVAAIKTDVQWLKERSK